MFFRRCRTLIPLGASLLFVTAALAGATVATAGTASAQTEITICLDQRFELLRGRRGLREQFRPAYLAIPG
jgi:hypothetical protein